MRFRVTLLGNAENIHLRRWAVHLARSFDLTVLSFEPARIPGVRVDALPGRSAGLVRYVEAAPFVRAQVTDGSAGLLHAHYAGGYGLTGALSGFHPYAVSVWGSDVYQAPRRSALNRRLLEFILGQADVLCSTSRAMADEARRYTSKPFHLTPFGVDCDEFSPSLQAPNEDELVIGTVKTLDPLYGIDRLLEAYALLIRRLPGRRLRLLVVGGGEQRSELERLAHRLGIASTVEFHGRASQAEVPALLRRMHVYVALSRSESFGVAVLEASATGIPVVVSDAGGLKETVLDGKTGFVVRNGEPAAAADALGRLLMDRSLRRVLGAGGRQFVLSRYRWADNAEKMDRLYRSIQGWSTAFI